MSLATATTILETRRDTIASELSGMGAMGPNFGLDGVSINNVEYAQALRAELTELTTILERWYGPCVITSQGR